MHISYRKLASTQATTLLNQLRDGKTSFLLPSSLAVETGDRLDGQLAVDGLQLAQVELVLQAAR